MSITETPVEVLTKAAECAVFEMGADPGYAADKLATILHSEGVPRRKWPHWVQAGAYYG